MMEEAKYEAARWLTTLCGVGYVIIPPTVDASFAEVLMSVGEWVVKILVGCTMAYMHVTIARKNKARKNKKSEDDDRDTGEDD